MTEIYFRGSLTNEQCEYIIKNYTTKSVPTMSKDLNVTRYQIREFMKKNNLTLPNGTKIVSGKFDVLTEEQREYIKENFKTEKTNVICKKLNITYDVLKSYTTHIGLTKDKYYMDKYIEEHYNKPNNNKLYLCNVEEEKVEILPRKHTKYALNENYFEVIDNEFKAYWLGFLYADGYNKFKPEKKESRIEICLCDEDKEHLVKFKNSIQTNYEIREKNVKGTDKIYKQQRISMTSFKMSKDLNDKGCTPNKSLTLTFPNETIVPKEYIRDFIRGYFDGDGCVHVNVDTKHFSLGFVGTTEFLTSIQSIFQEELNLTLTSLRPQGKAYCCSWDGIKNLDKIFKYLYKDCNIYLDRKFEKFNSLFCLD